MDLYCFAEVAIMRWAIADESRALTVEQLHWSAYYYIWELEQNPYNLGVNVQMY